jgi:dynein intermediate chain 1
MKQGSGLICGFSLKNPSFPEFTLTTETGVMCVDWHPTHTSLLCVGLYDGTVCVFDVHQAKNVPIFQSTVKTGKHTDPVWEVCWQEEDLAKNLNFFSVSSDGRVTLWTLGKSILEYSDVMQLKLVSNGSEAQTDDEASLCGLAGGCCFDFNKQSEHLFLVGTEEGKIHKCSKAYNSQYLETYDSHHMAVYTVRWNHFHSHVFISCSADWTVKVWDHRAKNPRMSYDLNNQVGDVAWTPWSSTTFAACTADGKVRRRADDACCPGVADAPGTVDVSANTIGRRCLLYAPSVLLTRSRPLRARAHPRARRCTSSISTRTRRRRCASKRWCARPSSPSSRSTSTQSRRASS